MFIIEITTAQGWRKLRDAGPFLLRESAEAYGSKYLRPGWRVVETTN